MSEPSQSDARMDALEGEAEEVDALPVLAGESSVAGVSRAGAGAALRPVGAVMPAVQAAAVAAGGFVAGAAVVGLVQRRQRRSTALAKRRRSGREARRRARGRGGRAGELVQVVGSRSFLVDVHLLGGSGPNR